MAALRNANAWMSGKCSDARATTSCKRSTGNCASDARATTSCKPWTGNCAAAYRHFNPLVNSPGNGRRALRLSQLNGERPRRQLQVAALFGGKKPAVVKETVIPDPDYRIPLVLVGVGGALIYSDNLFAGVPVGLLGLLILFQSTRVKFVFDNEALEVRIGEDLEDSGENVFVGGENRWKYSDFMNWEFWWPNFPVFVYFKTKPDQVHFFPLYLNGKQVYDVMVERCGPSKNSGPK